MLFTGREYDMDARLAESEAVTAQDVAKFAAETLCHKSVAISYVGKGEYIANKDLYADFLK